MRDISTLRWRADRNRWPRALNHIVDSIAERPMSLAGRLAARRLGTPQPGTPTSVFDDAPQRVLIAPVNYSGQGRAWSAALSHCAGISASNMAVEVPGGFSFDADLIVPPAVYHNDPDWQRRQFAGVAAGATHVLIEAEEPPFGRLLGRDTGRQAAALVERGVDVAFIAHGTDIRLPSRHVARTPWSHYRSPGVYVPRLEHVARENRALLDRMGRPVFVSTPDLLADVDYAIWCPVAVDTERWSAPRADRGERLRVAHAPSVAGLKGTQLIEPALEDLAARGAIDWRLVQGVPSSSMPEVFAHTDVLLDQFLAGSYGVAAVEAMSAGCVVVGHVLDDVRTTVREVTGLELPVVEATPDTVAQVVVELADDPARVDRLRAEGIDFAREVHDGRLSADILIRNWIQRGSD